MLIVRISVHSFNPALNVALGDMMQEIISKFAVSLLSCDMMTLLSLFLQPAARDALEAAAEWRIKKLDYQTSIRFD